MYSKNLHSFIVLRKYFSCFYTSNQSINHRKHVLLFSILLATTNNAGLFV